MRDLIEKFSMVRHWYPTFATLYLADTLGTHASVHLIQGPERGGGALPYMGYISMCRCEGYGFQAVYSRIGYIN